MGVPLEVVTVAACCDGIPAPPGTSLRRHSIRELCGAPRMCVCVCVGRVSFPPLPGFVCPINFFAEIRLV